ncbi:hypothetical protein [Protofrankia symbiont of Coriaria ruscifolia]|uniref:Uncharacterized protein n=1 Tax=Candidatus Protofrankia californiensis TaxID=1839754 RepID=A0A1C3NUF4_9ACTN|nr:hypothetical protein [Protofrankia symbiont of Coriaria ruscifolia]SBW18799.1 hypothetical protein FDG2_0825 [Candidatus Protofrankia californiensis]
MSTAPVDHHLDLTTQDILTYGSWGLTLVLLGVAIHLGRKERTPFYALIVLAAMVAAFAEPLYDAGLMLYFYSTEGMYTHFTAFGIPQPVWTHSGYAVLYAAPAIMITRKIRLGTLTRNGLFAWAGVELLMSCTFEMIGINGGAYTYWGPHELRILDYPLVIGVLEAAQVICFAVAATQLRERVKSPVGLLGLFVLFPCTFFMANFGAGSPVIIALHLEDTSRLIVALASLLSIAFAAAAIRGASSFLPTTAGQSEAAAVGSPVGGFSRTRIAADMPTGGPVATPSTAK